MVHIICQNAEAYNSYNNKEKTMKIILRQQELLYKNVVLHKTQAVSKGIYAWFMRKY